MSEGKARGRSIYCAPETQAAMREQAREADMPLSRLVVELARADDPDRHALALASSTPSVREDR